MSHIKLIRQNDTQTLPVASIRRQVRIPLANMESDFVTFHGLVDGCEHVALDFRKGDARKVPLVRLHSECLTGDVFSSARCDCGEQLQESLKLLESEGGVLIYLRQEGRGIGLYNKLDAYALQLMGHDTYEANRLLGLKDDLRDYAAAAQMLKAMGIEEVRLLSNNPLKAAQLEDYGIKVSTKQSTGVFAKAGNLSYLRAKVQVTGHLIKLNLGSEKPKETRDDSL